MTRKRKRERSAGTISSGEGADTNLDEGIKYIVESDEKVFETRSTYSVNSDLDLDNQSVHSQSSALEPPSIHSDLSDFPSIRSHPSNPSSHTLNGLRDPDSLSASTSTAFFPPSERAILTKENLRSFTKDTMPQKAGSAESKTTTIASDNSNVAQTRYILSQNHIYIEDEEAERRGAGLIKKAREIIKGGRKSDMDIEVAEDLRRVSRKHKSDNELTWLVNVWAILLNDTRWAKADDGMNDEEAIEWIEQAWEKDRLKCNWSADFVTNSIPPLELGGDPTLEAFAEQVKVKNPKPDLTYGLREEAFTELERQINFSHKARLSVNLDHPFFIVEAKSADGPIAAAENQDARAGAAMTYFKRMFNQAANNSGSEDAANQYSTSSRPPPNDTPAVTTSAPTSVPIPDETSFTFSLAIDPTIARMFVNWAEYKPRPPSSLPNTKPAVYYHMHLLSDYLLSDTAHWVALHHDINNVLDWGVGKRKREIKGLCEMIAEGGGKGRKRQRV